MYFIKIHEKKMVLNLYNRIKAEIKLFFSLIAEFQSVLQELSMAVEEVAVVPARWWYQLMSQLQRRYGILNKKSGKLYAVFYDCGYSFQVWMYETVKIEL